MSPNIHANIYCRWEISSSWAEARTVYLFSSFPSHHPEWGCPKEGWVHYGLDPHSCGRYLNLLLPHYFVLSSPFFSLLATIAHLLLLVDFLLCPVVLGSFWKSGCLHDIVYIWMEAGYNSIPTHESKYSCKYLLQMGDLFLGQLPHKSLHNKIGHPLAQNSLCTFLESSQSI